MYTQISFTIRPGLKVAYWLGLPVSEFTLGTDYAQAICEGYALGGHPAKVLALTQAKPRREKLWPMETLAMKLQELRMAPTVEETSHAL